MNNLYKKIDKFIQCKNVPNILLHGPFNHGKEDICEYILNNLYHTPNLRSSYVLNINCISVKGIKTIKENIKLFSMQIISNKSGVPFKTILLKHAEYLTYDSQYSLRRTIEQYSNSTRFILLCETKKNLLAPILSRFVPLYVNDETKTKHDCYNIHTNNPNQILKDFMNEYKLILEEPVDDSEILNNLYKLSEEIYKNNILSFEILHKFKKHENYNNVFLMFEKYRINVRNEIFCIFFLLCVFRNNQKIEIFDLY